MTPFIHARIYPGKDDDLIAWLEGLPAGDKSEAIRDALRAGLHLTASTRHQEIAAVVKQAVSEALVGLQIGKVEEEASTETNDVEDLFGAQLDNLLGKLG